ncbi:MULTISPECIES: hypothetical protein [unclassified Adlercreutzia]|uniref:hypothetical protein n=1 Tax=unclassified Adlercreutzia TaxID=2636013 RepID=UPI0013EBD968|nr:MULTISPECIES: hypothetical protein [unclassified Adlercreutzia]
MLPYFKRYVIICCVAAAAVPLIASTIWPLLTGQIMAASLPGLITLLVLFFGTMAAMQRVMGMKAQVETERLFALYNEQCDPDALIDQGAPVAALVEPQCGELPSWFMSYYAQALLDAGQVERAQAVKATQLGGVASLKKPEARAAVVVNMVPLALKLDEPVDALGLIEQGEGLLEGLADDASAQRRAYLASQRELVSARCAEDPQGLLDLCEQVRANAEHPLRLRVERAWDEAQACYRLGDAARERACLEFVVEHGNKLALVTPARTRLAALGE